MSALPQPTDIADHEHEVRKVPTTDNKLSGRPEQIPLWPAFNFSFLIYQFEVTRLPRLIEPRL
jgi:hypothetical protein